MVHDVEPFEASFLFENLKGFVFGSAGEHSTSWFVVGCAVAILDETLAQHLMVVMGRGTHQSIAVSLIY